jgi:hypothetical protein
MKLSNSQRELSISQELETMLQNSQHSRFIAKHVTSRIIKKSFANRVAYKKNWDLNNLLLDYELMNKICEHYDALH